jgi:hypothetical protein
MGLDQYLYAKKYFSPSEWRGEKAKEQFEAVITAVHADEFVTKDLPSAQVEVKVGYWRKSNQVHQWFVENCQNGEDDCREYLVDRAQLIELRDLCEKVLENNSLASELMPCQGGFFFGSTAYDEWYFSDLRDTVLIINQCLVEVPEEWDFYYQSSW